MELKKYDLVYIDVNYLRYLHDEYDTEVQYDGDNPDYDKKPHVGILLSNNGMKYVIPLTSAKPKHITWDDVSATYYRIYDTIDIRTEKIDEDDIILEIINEEELKKFSDDKRPYMKKKLLSVLDIKKMIPIKEGVYKKVSFVMNKDTMTIDEMLRIPLMKKERDFIEKILDEVVKKADKIYKKQMRKGVVLKFHCDYKKLEEACREYKI